MSQSRALAERVPYVFVTPSIPQQRSAYHAYQVLRAAYALLFVLIGADKYLRTLTNWDLYLAEPFRNALPLPLHSFMLVVGAGEIFLGILVALVPRIGAFAAAAWLAAITVNVLLLPGYPDIALRNLGLTLGAVALGFLARSQRGPLLPRGL